MRETTLQTPGVPPPQVASNLLWYQTSLFTSAYVSTSAFPHLPKELLFKEQGTFYFKCINAFMQ